MSYGTTELPYTAARIKGIIKATGQITVKPAGLAGIQLDCNGATGDFTASITPANLTANRRWTLPNRDDTFAGLGAQSFTGLQSFLVAAPSVHLGVNGSVNGGFKLWSATLNSEGNIYADATYGFRIDTNSNARPIRFDGSQVEITSRLLAQNTTASTSPTTGALVVAGGAGVGGALNVGGALEVSSATLIKTNTTLTDGAAAAVGTLTNAPTAGNPTKWVLINDNGVIRKFPTWT